MAFMYEKMKTIIQRHVSFITDPSGANMGDLCHMRMMFRRERQIHNQTHDLDTIIAFMDIIHHPVFYLKQNFGDWILSPSSG
jgi:hypothetical protein